MAIAYSEIARVLDGARRRQGWIVLGTALGAGAAAALVVLAGGAALLGTGLGPPHAVRAATLAGAALVLLCALFWAAAALLRRASSPAAVARSLGEARPELESDLLSSVELEGEYEELQRSGRYSVALVDAHIARTAERTRGLALAEVIPATPARRALSALAVVVFANLVAVAAAPRVLGQGWQRLAGLGPTVPVRRAEPITGDVEVTYVYPAYMKREPKTLSGTGGELSAPKGTAVTLKTRADREVQRGEIALENAEGGTAAPSSDVAADRRAGARPPPPEATAGSQVFELTVRNSRDLEAHLTLDAPGAYRFRYFHGKKLVAEGPAIPIAVEVDAAPEIRITAPAPEIEVDARARVRVEWTASDDVGLEKLTLVTKPPEGEERRAELKSFAGTRRESGVHELELAPLRLAEGEKLLYRLEVQDGDVVSGPKKGTSATHTIKIYSEAEHHRAALLRAQALWEDMVKLLGDRLEFFDGGARWSDERVARAQGFDGRTRTLHEGLRGAAQELRKDRSAPRQLPQALANVAAALRPLEEDLASLRLTLARMLHFQRGGASTLFDRVAEVDGRLDRELEKDILYLEQLFDQQRADDLVKVAKDLAARRRDLARLLEDYKKAPSDAARKELLAEVSRMKARMAEMLRRMGELAKGINDEHMNREALAEMARSKDAMGGLDEVEKKLAQGDLEGAMKALDQLGNAMQDMLASLERTAGRPGEQNAALMKDMLAFKKELEDVKAEQENVARDTDQVKGEYQKRLAQKLKQLEAGTKQLEGLAKDARRELERSEPGVSSRSEDEYGQARERLGDLQKALAARDLDAALETVKRALPPMQRLAMDIGDEAAMAERYRALRSKDPDTLREAQRHAAAALGPARKVRDELERMFPDPRQVLGPKEQDRLSQLSEQQGKLERRAGELRQKLSELSQRAPVFPPQAQEMLGGSQGHMERAQGELAQKNPQRGHGEQRQALDDLGRFQRGLDEMAKNSKRGQGGGGGFPFPFGEEQGGREGDGTDPSQEKVEIPGADAFKAPDEFRKDLLEAMKQGTPEPYQGEVKRYYEELVK